MDGTLIDSMWLWKAIDIEYLNRFGIPFPEDLQASIEGMSFHETAVYCKQRFSIPDSLDKMKADWNEMAWEKYTKEVFLKPGAYDFIKKARGKGVRLAICSSNSRELVDQVLSVLGIFFDFEVTLTGSDIHNGKPAPDIYLTAMERLGLAPEDCLVFEDICQGIKAGHNAGMQVCAVWDEYSMEQDFEKRTQAEYYIEDFTKALDFLN